MRRCTSSVSHSLIIGEQRQIKRLLPRTAEFQTAGLSITHLVDGISPLPGLLAHMSHAEFVLAYHAKFWLQE